MKDSGDVPEAEAPTDSLLFASPTPFEGRAEPDPVIQAEVGADQKTVVGEVATNDRVAVASATPQAFPDMHLQEEQEEEKASSEAQKRSTPDLAIVEEALGPTFEEIQKSGPESKDDIAPELRKGFFSRLLGLKTEAEKEALRQEKEAKRQAQEDEKRAEQAKKQAEKREAEERELAEKQALRLEKEARRQALEDKKRADREKKAAEKRAEEERELAEKQARIDAKNRKRAEKEARKRVKAEREAEAERIRTEKNTKERLAKEAAKVAREEREAREQENEKAKKELENLEFWWGLRPMQEPAIKPGHVLSVVVLASGEEEFSEEKRVTSQGVIALPLIGSVGVEGKKLPDLKKELDERYREYIRTPMVDVAFSIDESPDSISPWGSVSVMGRVVNPGGINIPPTQDLTVSRAIQLAGGYDSSAKDTDIVVTRVDKAGEKHKITLNMKKAALKGQLHQDIRLEPGDVVYVPERIF